MALGRTAYRILATGVALGAFAAYSSAANAGAIVYSTLEINNFTISGSGGQLDLSNFDLIGISNSTAANTTLNGSGTSDSETFAGPTDVGMVCQGDCGGFGQNQFSQTPFPPIGQFTRGDAQLIGAGITGTGATQDFVTATTVAESQLNLESDSTAGSNTGTVTRFSFAGFDDALTFDFDADTSLYAELTDVGMNAQSSVAWSLSILQDGVGTIFSFAPTAIGPGAACSLNMTVGTLTSNGPQTYDCSGSFSATSPVLSGGSNYTLVINHQSNVRAENGAPVDVPEPEAAALLGLGLLGLMAARRRSRRA